MSTSRTTALNPFSSILIALKRMGPPSPEKILNHLRDPTLSTDYHYLDALATLCSFVAQCDSASAAVTQNTQSNCLYLTAKPSAPLSLQDLVPTWIVLIQNMSHQIPRVNPSDSPTNESDSESEGSPQLSDSEQNFILEVYRTCSAKLLEAVKHDNAARTLLKLISGMDERMLSLLQIENSPLVPSVKLLMSAVEELKVNKSLSPDLLVKLHQATGVVAQFKDEISGRDIAPLFETAYRLSHAVNTIITFATSPEYSTQINLPWTVVWAEVPNRAPKFIATTNSQELAKIVTKTASPRYDKSYDTLVAEFDKWAPFKPSQSIGDVQMVKESHDHFTGNGTVHCESALLHYLIKNGIVKAAEPYIGCSHPICYACLMLVRACNAALKLDAVIHVGPRCVDWERLDIAWTCPDMGPAVYNGLMKTVAWDFGVLSTQPHYSPCRPIVTDPRDAGWKN